MTSFSESPETPLIDQLPLTPPNFSPQPIQSELKNEKGSVHIDLEELEQILNYSKSKFIDYTPTQVANYLINLWKLPQFMKDDIVRFCTEKKLNGKNLISLDEEAIVNLGFNNLWTLQLLKSLELLFSQFSPMIPLERCVKTLKPKYQLSFKKSHKKKISSLKLKSNDLPLPIQQIFDVVENNAFEYIEEEGDGEYEEEREREEKFSEENSTLLNPFEELQMNLERHYKLTQLLKPLASLNTRSRSINKDDGHWVNIIESAIYDYWWVWLGLGGLISYRLSKSNR